MTPTPPQFSPVPGVEDIGALDTARPMFWVGRGPVHAPLASAENALSLNFASRPIEYFGAKGSDATKDTQAMADALEWAASTDGRKSLGGRILFGPREYRIGETQRISCPITLEGAGGAFMNQFSSTTLLTNGSVLKLETGVNANMFECWLDTTLFSLVQDYRGFMRFTNLLLHGNRSANGNHPNTDLNSIGSGIVAKGTRYVIVDNCTVMMFAQDGIATESYDFGSGAISPNNIEVHQNRIHNNGRRGVDINSGDGTLIGNSIGYNYVGGARCLGLAIVSNNWAWNNIGNGFEIGANADTLVIGNKSYDNQKSGFVLSSDLPGGHIIGNMSLRNNAGAVPWTDPIDSSGFYIGSTSTSLSLVGNMAHNLYSSNVKQQLYGFYFNDATTIAAFDGNFASNNLTNNYRLASSGNIRWHANTGATLANHPGFIALNPIDLNNNSVRNVQYLSGNAWAAKTISSNTLAAGNDRYCAVTPSGAVTLNTITTAATGIMELFIRNADATNAITVTHNVSAIRCPNAVDATISPYEMRHFVLVSGSVWQMLGA